MKNLKKYLLVALFLVLGLLLVACGEPVEEEPEIPEAPAPTELTVYSPFFDEREAIEILVNEVVTFEVEVDEGANPEVEWTVADATVAELQISEDGEVSIKALKVGKSKIIATSTKAEGLSAEKEFVVLQSKDAAEVMAAAKVELDAAMPKMVAGDTELPKSTNPLVEFVYSAKPVEPFKIENGVLKASAFINSEGFEDITKEVTAKIKYKDKVLDNVYTITFVKDINNNDITCAAKVTEKLGAIFDNINKDGGKITENITLPKEYTAEEVGRNVSIVWTIENAAGSMNAEGVYTKPLADTVVTFSCLISKVNEDGTKVAIAKGVWLATTAGSTPDEVVDYFFSKKLAPKDGDTVSKAYFTLASKDTQKKYTKLYVVWECEDENMVIKSDKGTPKANGEYTLKGTFYYDFKEPTYDEAGNMVTKETYVWKKEVTITINCTGVK